MSFLTRPPYDRTAVSIMIAPRKLSRRDVARLHAMYLQRESCLKRIAFIDGQITKLKREEGL